MKYTNLQLVQTILSSMDSDEVDSVDDTPESLQVLAILRTVYYDIAALGQLPRDNDLFQLQASGDATKPVTMFIPAGVEEIEWLKYDYATFDQPATLYQPLKPLPLWEFINQVSGLDPSTSNITSYHHLVGSDNFKLYCRNDIPPCYYTTANDNTILFDGYDSTVDTTLQSSKTMGWGKKGFTWSDADGFVPPLDDVQSQRLLHEAKSLAFAELKQTQHVKAEKSARDIKIAQQSSKYKLPLQTAYDQLGIIGRRAQMWTKPTGRYK